MRRRKQPGTYFDIINEKFQRHDDGSVTGPTKGMDFEDKKWRSHAEITKLKNNYATRNAAKRKT